MFLDVTQRCLVGFCFWSLYVWTRNIEVSTSNRVFAESFASSDPFGLFTNIVFLGGNTKTFETYLLHTTTAMLKLARCSRASWEDKSFRLIWRIAWDLDLGFTLPDRWRWGSHWNPPFSVGWTKFNELTPQWSSAYKFWWAQKAVKNGEVCIFGACIQFKSVLMVLKTV